MKKIQLNRAALAWEISRICSNNLEHECLPELLEQHSKALRNKRLFAGGDGSVGHDLRVAMIDFVATGDSKDHYQWFAGVLQENADSLRQCRRS